MIPIVRNIKRYFSLAELTVVFLALTISVTAGIGVFHFFKKDVTIIDNGRQTVVKTMKSTVAEVLQQNDIKVEPCDYISLPMDYKLKRNEMNKITIKRAVPVNLIADGEERTIMTYRETVGDVIGTCGIAMNDSDRLEGVSADDRVTSNMDIRIVRVNEKLVTENVEIPYSVVRKENRSLAKGVEKVITKGQPGVKERLFRVVTEDGKEVLRELIKESVVKNPVSMVVEFGSLMTKKTSRGESLRYNKVLDMVCTAYTASYADTGKRPGDPLFGITASGMKAREGIVAVDPKVIPLGTKLYIEIEGSTPDYGFAIAGDTGGAIKGNKIDLYYDDVNFVRNFGRKKCKVYILYD